MQQQLTTLCSALRDERDAAHAAHKAQSTELSKLKASYEALAGQYSQYKHSVEARAHSQVAEQQGQPTASPPRRSQIMAQFTAAAQNEAASYKCIPVPSRGSSPPQHLLQSPDTRPHKVPRRAA